MAGPAPDSAISERPQDGLEYQGLTALVTGGTSGIGSATADLLLRRGARVTISGTPGDLATGLEQLVNRHGPDAVDAMAADVTDPVAVADLVRATVERWGGLDLLVCAAGIQRYGSATGTTPDEWDEVLSVNLGGAFLAVRESLPHLRNAPAGAVVIVSSVQAFITQTDVAAYTASKGGLNAFTRSVAIDEARYGVRANVVCPASVDTPMLRKAARDFSDGSDAGVETLIAAWGAGHPLGRVARADEVAEAICFLGSPRASFITGATLPVDGGLLAQTAIVLPQ